LGGRLGPDDGVAAGPIVDHDGLTEPARELVSDQARKDVGKPAGRVGHDDAD